MASAIVAGLCLLTQVSHAEESLCPGLEAALAHPPGQGDREVFLSNYTKHWRYSAEHKAVRAISLQQDLANHRFCGLSLFTNSFGQPSVYVYTGKTWPGIVPEVPKMFATVSAGMLYGYVYPYKNKVPFNVGGFSPAIVPALGYQITPQLAVQTQWLGLAAVMIGASWRY